eukprot:TRINITY_DN46345_c0_g1_i1.p1 TRINITY_DN46345_c0_g1~~TRINITY_DN46345_c0_g1_i1.p1  ORF type:complete len:725 (+),score=108.15 TRINITY_DN46345_c0_g1_i1:158-2332(+)
MKRSAISLPEGIHSLVSRVGVEKPSPSSSPYVVDSSVRSAMTRVSRLADWVPPARPPLNDGYVRLNEAPDMGFPSSFRTVARALKQRVPILTWLPHYDVRSNLFPDVVAGVTLGLICIVQTLAHASIATTEVIQGPYCAFVPPIVYAMLGTSRHASISSGAIVAILLADQLAAFEDTEERTHLASLLALMSGLNLVLLGLCRAAFLVRFLSQSLISGFVTGGSLLIIEGQIKNLCGLQLEHAPGFFATAEEIAKHLEETHRFGLALGLSTLFALNKMVDMKVAAKQRLKGPSPHPWWVKPAKAVSEMKEIVCVIIGISLAFLTRDEEGEALLPVVGHIPEGLPSPQAPWAHRSTADLLSRTPLRLREFFTAGCLLALTSFLTTYATAKKQASNHNYSIDATQETFALGLAGIAGSFFGAFTPSGSLSRTSLASEVGVKTQLNGIVLAAVVGIGLTCLTPILFYLPKATLAAIVMKSAWGLRDFEEAAQLWRQCRPYKEGGHRRDFVVWCLAFTITVFFGALYGIACAAIVGLVLIVYDAATPEMVTLGKVDGVGRVWRATQHWTQAQTYAGMLVVEPRGSLNYASAAHFQEALEEKLASEACCSEQPVKVVVLDFGSVHDLDPTAIVMFKEVLTKWRTAGIGCIIADAKSRVRLLLEENFGRGEIPLLNQPAFLISIEDAVDLGLRQLASRGVAQPGGPDLYSNAGFLRPDGVFSRERGLSAEL